MRVRPIIYNKPVALEFQIEIEHRNVSFRAGGRNPEFPKKEPSKQRREPQQQTQLI